MSTNFDENNFKREILNSNHREAIDIPKNLNLVERLEFLIKSGSFLQTFFVFKQLNLLLLEKNSEDSYKVILLLEAASIPIRLGTILENVELLDEQIAEKLVQHAVLVSDFESLLSFTSVKFVQLYLIPQVMEMCRFTKSTESRYLGINILIVITIKKKDGTLNDLIAGKIRALCQDTEFTIRQLIIILIHKLLGGKYRNEIIVDLMELMMDEEYAVRAESCVVSSQYLNQIHDKEFKHRILARISKLLKEKPFTPLSCKCICDIFEYGQISNKELDQLAIALHELIVQDSSFAHIIIPRLHIIYKRFIFLWDKLKLETDILEICQKKNSRLLLLIASNFPNLLALPLKDENIVLMIDCCLNSDVNVKFNLLANSTMIITELTNRVFPLKYLDIVKEKLCSIIKWEKDIWDSFPWREYLYFIEHFTDLLKCLNFEFSELSFIINKCLEVTNRCCFIPTRSKIFFLLLCCINHTKTKEQRDFYVRRIVQEWRHSPSVYKRLYYCEIVSICLSSGFTTLFKQCFFKEISTLLREPYIETKLKALELTRLSINLSTIAMVNDFKSIIEQDAFKQSKSLAEVSGKVLIMLIEYKESYKPEMGISHNPSQTFEKAKSISMKSMKPTQRKSSSAIKIKAISNR